MTTHADLVHAAHHWARNSLKCAAVLAECGAAGIEIPDVIAWGSNGTSIVVECKATRADFLADKKKFFRVRPDQGMGAFRWFFTPKGLVDRSELPPQWGLAELRGSRVFKVKYPERFHAYAERRETQLLVSALNRIDRGFGLQVFDPMPERPIGVGDDGLAYCAADLE
jgi:hypothetical protein